ncbi:MAG: Lrp/AsnC family transcriptional regulator [Candidatus Poseidoniaceae archaeon]|jgi:DNA-binding Lrp family transcriptional regulator|nr:Lrp/AsnC family transcriptional regulator [Candidatus Poseidoniaceae archaeon]MDP7001426.1 Lrp/AsnC family transcriptional regulator [Candidatus Poseidoniaceae archaeon]
MVELDEVDRRILAELLADGRASQRKLASLIGVAQGTVTNRLTRMTDLGIIRGYHVDLDPQLVGWSMTVLIGLRIDKRSILSVQSEVAADNRVCSVYDVTGEFDSMVVARVRDPDDLNDLTKNVLSIEGISRSSTHVVLNTVKESYSGMPENTGRE